MFTFAILKCIRHNEVILSRFLSHANASIFNSGLLNASISIYLVAFSLLVHKSMA